MGSIDALLLNLYCFCFIWYSVSDFNLLPGIEIVIVLVVKFSLFELLFFIVISFTPLYPLSHIASLILGLLDIAFDKTSFNVFES